MSILATQNINNFASSDDTVKWARNLGSETQQSALAGWGGYTYNPPDLENLNRSEKFRQGPQDKTIKRDGAQQYGQEGFARAPNDSDHHFPTTVLGAFSLMISDTNVASWGTGWAAKRMAQTFASGDQMRSLRDSTDASSGGARDGYSEQSQYRITNWNDANAGAHGNVQPAIPSAFDHTGIRNIEGMRTELSSPPPEKKIAEIDQSGRTDWSNAQSGRTS